MSDPREDDLFRESTMTFGQHLEELRSCLIKAVGGLFIGVIVGLCVGNYVVAFIQQPLLRALAKYYQEASKEQIAVALTKLEQSGQVRPWTDEQVTAFIDKDHLFFDEFYVDPTQIIQELKSAYPKEFKNLEVPVPTEAANKTENATGAEEKPTDKNTAEKTAGADRAQLIRLFLWHRSKDDPRLQTKSLAMIEPFSIYLKASLLVGVLLSSPWVFYQIWNFVAAGLYPRERQYVIRYLPFSLALFLSGAALAFFVVFQPVLDFLLGYNRVQGIVPEARINEWLSFMLILPIGFGIGFQLPLVMLFLERIGVFSVPAYLSHWRVSVLVIFVLAGILAPPDAYSMLLLAGSLTLLYFGGILLCKLLPRRPKPFES